MPLSKGARTRSERVERPYLLVVAVLFVALLGTFPRWVPLPAPATVAGPSARELVAALDLPPGFRDSETQPMTNDDFQYSTSLVTDGWARTAERGENEEISVIAVRTGTENLALEARSLLIQFLIDGDAEFLDDPFQSTKRGYVELEGITYPVTSWAEADATLIVADLRGPENATSDELVLSLQRQAAELGLDAPYVAADRRMVAAAGINTAAVVVAMLLIRSRMARFRGSRRISGPPPLGARVVTSDAKASRLNGRGLDIIQGGTLVLAAMASTTGLLWVPRGHSLAFVGLMGPLLLVMLLVVGGATAARRATARRVHRPPLEPLQTLMLAVLILVALAAFGFGTVLLAMFTQIRAASNELPSRVTEDLAFKYQFLSIGSSILVSILALAFYYVAALVIRLTSWVRSPRPVHEGWTDPDQSVGTLLLRPFDEDRRRVPRTPSLRRGLIEAWTLRSTDRLEEILCWELSNRGPVDAVGQPGSSRRRLGAVRVALNHEDWQGAIWRRVHLAPLVVAILGTSEGLMWEISALFQSGAMNRAVLLVPPGNFTEREAAWRAFLSVSAGFLPGPRPSPQAHGTLAVTVQHGIVRQYAADRTDEAGYRVALRAATRDLSDALSPVRGHVTPQDGELRSSTHDENQMGIPHEHSGHH